MTFSVNKLLTSKGSIFVSFAWAGFILENLIISHNREEIINRFGEEFYHLLYSTLSLLSCGAISVAYFKHCRGKPPILLRRTPAWRVASFVLQAAGFTGFSQLVPTLQLPLMLAKGKDLGSQSLHSSPTLTGSIEKNIPSVVLRCPIDFKASKPTSEDGIVGLQRVTRHATLWSLGLVSLGRAVVIPFLPEVVMFSFPIVFACIGGYHQDYRYRRNWGGMLPKAVDEKSSNIPFAALLTGKQSWKKLSEEIKWSNAFLACGLAAVIALKRTV